MDDAAQPGGGRQAHADEGQLELMRSHAARRVAQLQLEGSPPA